VTKEIEILSIWKHVFELYCSYHWTSSCLQYTGFARDFSLPLTNAAGEEIEWDDEDFLPEKITDHLKERTVEKNNPFKVGWKLEAVDLMDPRLICPSTVKVCVVLTRQD
jgi:hypothetical protein